MTNSRQASQRQESKPATTKAKDTSNNKNKNNTSATSGTTHTVAKGESLYRISQRYGVSVDEIRNANNIKGDGIKAGQKIKIPAKSNKTSSKRRR